MIEWVLRQLGQNNKCAVLSRGYKRESNGFLIVEPDLAPEEAGDEPLQIARKFPKTIVAVDRNRQRGIANLEMQHSPDLILLDDAFQHRKVKASLNVLLTAYSQPYSQDWYLPTGNLRDHRSQSKRAKIIIVTKCPDELDEGEQNKIISSLNPDPAQLVLFSSLEYHDQVTGINDSRFLSSFASEEVLLVTAIANPEPLLHHLRQKGIQFQHRNFPDHHYFTEKEMMEFNKVPFVLTTEKDFTRMGGKVSGAYYLPVQHQFLNDGKEKFLSKLNSL